MGVNQFISNLTYFCAIYLFIYSFRHSYTFKSNLCENFYIGLNGQPSHLNNDSKLNAKKFNPEESDRIKKFNEAFLRSKNAIAYGDYKTLFESFTSQLDQLTREDLEAIPYKLSNMASYLFVEIDKLGDCDLLEYLAEKMTRVGIAMTEVCYISLACSYLRIGNLPKTIEWLDKLNECDILPRHRSYIKLFKELANNEHINDIGFIHRLFEDMERYGVSVSPELVAFAIIKIIKMWATKLIHLNSYASTNSDVIQVLDDAFDFLEHEINYILDRLYRFQFSDKMLNLDTAIWLNNILDLIKPPHLNKYISRISNVISENTTNDEPDNYCGKCNNCPMVIGCDIIEPEVRLSIFTKWLQNTYKYNRAELPSLSLFYARLYRAHVMKRPYTYILDGANIGLHRRGNKVPYSNLQVEVIRGLLEKRGKRSLIILPNTMGFPPVYMNTCYYEHCSVNDPILLRLINNSIMLNRKHHTCIRKYYHETIYWNIYKEWCNLDAIHVCEQECYDDNYMFLASIATLCSKEALLVDEILSNALNVKPMRTNSFEGSIYDGKKPAFVITQDTIREFCIPGVSESHLMRWKEYALIPYQLSNKFEPHECLLSNDLTGKELLSEIQSCFDEATVTNDNLISYHDPPKPLVFLGYPPKYSLRTNKRDNLWHFPISLERLFFNADSRYKTRMRFLSDYPYSSFYITTTMPELYMQKRSDHQCTDWLCIDTSLLTEYRNEYKKMFNDNPKDAVSHLEDLDLPERLQTQHFPGKRWQVASKKKIVLKDIKTDKIASDCYN